MSDNMTLYNAVRTPPPEALKAITGGRLKGMTDINPMWRIKTMTEQFGPCGDGWWYTIDNLWTEAGAGGEIAAFARISLYYRINGEVVQPIPGIGGSMLVSKEKNGLYTDDEAYKKAITDALSVACKALGVAADVYWQSDRDKYNTRQEQPQTASRAAVDKLYQLWRKKGYTDDQLPGWSSKNMGNTPDKLTEKQVNRLIKAVEGWPDAT